MNKNISKTLLAITTLMLFHTCSNLYASPFDNLKKGFEDVKEKVSDKISDGAEAIKKGAKAVKNGVKDKAEDVKDFFVEGYSDTTSKINGLFNKSSKPSCVKAAYFLPGHETKEMVCQGIAYLPETIGDAREQGNSEYNRYILLSYYPSESEQPSQLVVFDRERDKAIRRFALHKKNGNKYTGHAGGIAVAGKYVWVASGGTIYGYSTEEILNHIKNKEVKAAEVDGLPRSLDVLPGKNLTCQVSYSVDSKASYVSFDGKYIWVGDFARKGNKSYSPIKHHNAFNRNCWIAGYLVDADGMPTSTTTYTYNDGDSEKTVHKPDGIIAMRDTVQGMAICGNYAALTTSFGAINSKLALYNNPLKEKGESFSYTPAGQSQTFTVEAWELEDKKNWRNTVTLAAGAEDLEFDGANLYVTFECSSKNYNQKWKNMNPTIKLTEDFYIIDINKALQD